MMRHSLDRPRAPTPQRPARYVLLDRVTLGVTRPQVDALRRRPQPSGTARRMQQFLRIAVRTR